MMKLAELTIWWLKSGWVFISLASLLTARWIDINVFPVIDEFTVKSVLVTPTGVRVSGDLHKPGWRESCRLHEVVASVNGVAAAPITFMDLAPGQASYTRPAGLSAWGPWMVAAPDIRTMRLVSRHSCHGLWDHTATLAEITVER